MTLADHLAHYEAGASTSTPRDVAIRRAFMAGALAALTDREATREQLLAEVVQFGRAVGSPAERAST